MKILVQTQTRGESEEMHEKKRGKNEEHVT